MIEIISASIAKQMVDTNEDIIVVDVREKDEYDQGHIVKAINVPLSDLVHQSELLLTDKKKTLLVYCRSGKRSAVAARKLNELGYETIYDFGGILSWPYEVIK